MLRTRICSDLETLDNLSLVYPWILDSQSIRPSLKDIERKSLLLTQIEDEWISNRDYIFHTIFGEKYHIGADDKKYVKSDNLELNVKWSFQPSMFKYKLSYSDTNHWILWNSEKDLNWEYEEEKINHIITIKLLQHLETNSSPQFVWYKNPKPTIPEFYHVQVFWISE